MTEMAASMSMCSSSSEVWWLRILKLKSTYCTHKSGVTRNFYSYDCFYVFFFKIIRKYYLVLNEVSFCDFGAGFCDPIRVARVRPWTLLASNLVKFSVKRLSAC